jgi:hypothetical protein
MATEKLKNCPKTQNPLGIKILPELKSVFFGVFKVKKKKNLNISPLVIYGTF